MKHTLRSKQNNRLRRDHSIKNIGRDKRTTIHAILPSRVSQITDEYLEQIFNIYFSLGGSVSQTLRFEYSGDNFSLKCQS